jgi:hypothetical protein
MHAFVHNKTNTYAHLRVLREQAAYLHRFMELSLKAGYVGVLVTCS